jgi:STE24 endopeptidase
MEYLDRFTSLPWQPIYTQSGSSMNEATPEEKPLLFYGLAVTVAFTVLVYGFESYLDGRQMASFHKVDFPEALAKTVSAIDASGKQEEPLLPQLQEKFKKAQTYGLDKIRFGMIAAMYDVLESLSFLLIGFMPYIWDFSTAKGKEWFGWTEQENEIRISLIFLGAVTIVGTITSLPFSLWSTFMIERKHGFNKQTLGLFFADKVKELVLTALIGAPFVSVMLWIIKAGGTYFYLYIWAFMFVFSVFMMTIVPVVVMPLFNKYEPLPEGDLKDSIYALAGRLKYPLKKLFVMDGSKRSSHSNAFMFGFGSNKRIVLFDTLIEQVTEKEILAILGHELGHWKLGHTLSSFAITQLYVGTAFYVFALTYGSKDLPAAFGFDDPSRPVPTIISLLIFFQTLWAPVDKVLSFLLTINSRFNEFAADKFSVDLDMSRTLQSGLCKIHLENLGAMNPDPLYSAYHYSHPPLVERLRAMMALDQKKA